jgi:hypothetical protein
VIGGREEGRDGCDGTYIVEHRVPAIDASSREASSIQTFILISTVCLALCAPHFLTYLSLCSHELIYVYVYVCWSMYVSTQIKAAAVFTLMPRHIKIIRIREKASNKSHLFILCYNVILLLFWTNLHTKAW